MNEKPTKTQLERVTIALNLIVKDISEQDKKKCTEVLKISYSTVWRYLNGRGSNPSLAINLLDFFRKEIDAREIVLMQATA